MDEDKTARANITNEWRRQRAAVNWLNALTLVLGVATLTAAVMAIVDFGQSPVASTTESSQDRELRADIQRRLDEWQKATFKAIQEAPTGEQGAQVAALNVQLEQTQARLANLEAAITASPEKALAIPMLRKDLDNDRESARAAVADTNRQIDRIYDQNKWFIGLTFTMALAVIGLAASNFVRTK